MYIKHKRNGRDVYLILYWIKKQVNAGVRASEKTKPSWLFWKREDSSIKFQDIAAFSDDVCFDNCVWLAN